MLIGITGVIGAGKSVVTEYLGEVLGAEILSADEICRSELQKDQAGYRGVIQAWGATFLGASKEIDRTRLRNRVFKDSSVRQQLEDILHPLVRERLLRAKEVAGRNGFVVAEVPLLFESGWQADFDWIVCVHVTIDQAIARVAHRDNSAEDEILEIIGAQISAAQKKEHADSVIDNTAGLSGTKKQVDALAHVLRTQFSTHTSRKL